MEDEYLKKIWNTPDKEMEQFLTANHSSFQMIQMKKITSKLRALKIKRIIGIVLGLGWIAFMFLMIYLSVRYSPVSLGKIFFVGSLAAILIITSIAVFIYVKDLFMIRQTNLNERITITQRRLAMLKLSIFKSVQISWLQLPFYTTWYINSNMIVHGHMITWILQILITGVFTWITVWLFININEKNLEKKWLRNLINGTGFNSINQAMDFVNEIDAYQSET